MDSPPSTAIVGLGAMGLPVCMHVQAAGIAVSGWDADPKVRAAASDRGARVPETLPEALRGAEVAMFLVGSEASMHAVVREAFGEMASGSVHVVMGTISPELAEEIADEGARNSQFVVSAPLCRTVAGVQAANALALVSGDREIAERIRPVLSAFCTDILHVGTRAGDAQVAKAVNNLMLWASAMANEEGFRLAAAYGLDLETLRQGLVISTADSWSLREWQHAAEWPWSIKDLAVVAQMASAKGLDTPLSERLSSLVRNSEVLTHAPVSTTKEPR